MADADADAVGRRRHPAGADEGSAHFRRTSPARASRAAIRPPTNSTRRAPRIAAAERPFVRVEQRHERGRVGVERRREVDADAAPEGGIECEGDGIEPGGGRPP